MTSTLVFQHPERFWLAAAVTAIALALLVVGYWRSPLRGALRFGALGCKMAAWALLIACIADPQWARQQPKKGENEIAIVADNSAGMQVAEKLGQPTRGEQMRQALGKADAEPKWMTELAASFRVKTLLVDERLQSVPDFGGLNFAGTRSDLCRAVQSIRESGATRSLAAVVLMTDGNATDAEAWSAAAKSKAPVFPVLIGEHEPESDLAIKEVTVTQTAFEDSPVMMAVRIEGRGFDGQEVAVCALDEAGKVVAEEKQRIVAGTPPPVMRLRVTGAKPGVSFYRVVVLPSELRSKMDKDAWKAAVKEVTAINNERLVAVDRGRGPYRVLYVSGRPNWEYKFLRRALAADEEVQMPSLIRIAKREPKFEWRGRTGETSNPLFRGFGEQTEAQRYDQPVLIRLQTKDARELFDGFPKSAEQLFGSYRAIVIDDLEAEFFTQEQMNLIERFVSERGGALLMLGGQECYQSGKYDHTPVGRMLPVYLDRVSAAAPVANGRFNLTREGWLEPWTRLRANQADDEQRLATMPGFFAVNQTFSVKPGASVLATVSGGETTYPALVAHRFGEGRVAALTIGDVWRWGMRDEAAMKDQERAWRQLMRWLVVDVPDRIDFQTESVGTAGAQTVKFAVRARDEAFRPLDDAVVKLEVTGPNAAAPGAGPDNGSALFGEPSLKESGLFEAEFFPKDRGAYRAVATVTKARADQTVETVGTKSTGWVFDPLAAEFSSLQPNLKLMERLARETGGRVLTLQDLPRLPEILRGIDVPVQETLTEPLWHTPWMFIAILGLLAGEWFLRKKGGAV